MPTKAASKRKSKRVASKRKSKRVAIDPASDDAPEEIRAPWRASKKAEFLDQLREHYGLVTRAAEAAGLRTKLLYQWRAADEAFAAEWEEAVEQSTDLLEAEAIRRGVEGYRGRPVVHRGEVVCEITEYSDQMLSLMLKSRRAKFYDLKRIAGPDGEGPAVIITKVEREIVDPEGES